MRVLDNVPDPRVFVSVCGLDTGGGEVAVGAGEGGDAHAGVPLIRSAIALMPSSIM
jgi:hypothetical protein